MKIFIRGLNACLQRKADLQRYVEYLEANRHEIVKTIEASDTILLWTCAYRQDQHNHSLEVIDRYKNLEQELIVCGCLPSINPEGLKEHFDGKSFEWKFQEENMRELFGGGEASLSDFELPVIERCLPADLETYRKEHPEVKVGYTDQFIKIYVSEGCEFNCTYCAERLAFPKYKSVPVEKLVDACKKMIEETGQKRIVLWADSLGDYGHDIGCTLSELIQALLKIAPDVEIGIENIHPKHFLEQYDSLIKLIKKKKIFLLNMPIQSASDRILKMMNRLYTRADLDHIFIGLTEAEFDNCETDIIVGFPTETDAEYQETLDMLIHYQLKYVKISGYLETPGMPSNTIVPKIAAEEIRQRVLNAGWTLQEANIICNYDNNEVCQERFSKNLVELW
ncbi:tRNA N6-threonylcarbamoyladenosine [Candidatus Magnetomoraceae bacterium gMMP-1]